MSLFQRVKKVYFNFKAPLCMAQATFSCRYAAIHLVGSCQNAVLTEGLFFCTKILNTTILQQIVYN